MKLYYYFYNYLQPASRRNLSERNSAGELLETHMKCCQELQLTEKRNNTYKITLIIIF